MRKYLTWQSAARVVLALGAAAMLGGYWYTQQQKVSRLQQQIDQLPNDKDSVSLEKDRITLENTINGSLIQAVGGLLLFVTAYVSLQNLKATQRSVLVAEEKQVTERFTQAINQLGSDKIEIRFGGIYALERIAKDSPRDHWTIMEVLTSFIQENSPLTNFEQPKNQPLVDTENSAQSKESPLTKIAKDIQAALTVIRRRESRPDSERGHIDLSGTYLVESDLQEANLYKATLQQANLYKATLCKAHLQEANLSETNLSEAYLQEANLKGANLQRANFSGADLNEADLREANLFGANLREAKLNKVNLKDADLSYAKLTWANLENADLSGTEIYDTNLKGAHLYGANLSKAHLGKVDLSEAHLGKVDFREATLYKTKFDEADLREANLNGANLSMAFFQNAKNLTPEQVKAAKNWKQAHYDEDFRQKLGLPPESENS